MFYYAEINSEYQVINKYCLTEESTNPNYILITEDLYNNGNELGDIVGQFYNTLSNVIEIVDPGWDMGQTCWMRYKDSQMRLSTKLDNMDKATSLKANIDHTHEGYANSDDLQELEDTIATKANTNHSHTEYASVSHTHDNYATQVALDTLGLEVDDKADANHTHSDYSTATHNHDSSYSPLSHSHTASEIGAATSEHNHNSVYATITSLNELSSVVSGKANSSHNHNGVYDEYGAAANALTSANAYTNSKIDTLVGEGASETLNTIGEISEAITDNQDAIDLLNAAIANKANVIDVNSHTSNTEIHITNAERNQWNAKSNFSGNYNDLTNKPAIPSISGLATETYVNTQIDEIDIPSALSDLVADSTHRVVTDVEKATWNAKSDFSGNYNDLIDKPSIPSISGLATETYVDEAVSTKANSSHTHTIANISNLQSTLDGKANSSHTHTVANISNLTATATELNYMDGVTSNVQTQLDGKAASGHTHSYLPLSGGTLTGALKPYTLANQEISGTNNTKIRIIPDVPFSLIDPTHTDEVYFKALLKWICETYPLDADTTYIGSATPNSKATVVIRIYSNATVDSSTKLPQYSSGLAITLGGSPKFFGTTSYNWYWNNMVTSSNYTSYTPTKTGSGASGTWGISVTGNAATATKLGTNAGSATQPVYFSGGKPVATTYTLGKSVPSDAKFTDTTYGNATTSNSGLMSSSDKSKLDGIAIGANNYTLPAAGSALGGVKSGGDVTISSGVITVNDDSHNHIISNVDGLQTALDGKSATSHNHNSAYIAKDLQMTSDTGDVEMSWSNKDVVAEIKALGMGMHTVYAVGGTTNNPKTTESWRYLIHKTSAAYGWVQAFGSNGSMYIGYLDNSNWKGWKCIYDSTNKIILWSGESYLNSSNSTPQTVTPSKKLSECRTGWLLLWSDYDPGEGSNESDFCTTFIPKYTPSGGTWGGKAFYCDIALYVGGDANDLSTEKRCIKPVYVHDNKLVGSYQNTSGGRNDVVLRAVYEI